MRPRRGCFRLRGTERVWLVNCDWYFGNGGWGAREVEPVTSTWRTVTRDSAMLRPSRIRDLTPGRSERAVAMRGCGEVCRRRRASARESPREDGTTMLKGILKSQCCVDIKRYLPACPGRKVLMSFDFFAT
jgi:hypothetical protein